MNDKQRIFLGIVIFIAVMALFMIDDRSHIWLDVAFITGGMTSYALIFLGIIGLKIRNMTNMPNVPRSEAMRDTCPDCHKTFDIEPAKKKQHTCLLCGKKTEHKEFCSTKCRRRVARGY